MARIHVSRVLNMNVDVAAHKHWAGKGDQYFEDGCDQDSVMESGLDQL